MLERFVDTSGWAAWADRDERFHAQARRILDETWDHDGRLVTTNLVLIELTSLLISPLRVPRPQQIALLDDLRGDPSVEVVPIDAGREAAAWALWRSRTDKDWTLVDCASFVLMEQRGLLEAVTSDHHFEQAGFRRLLKPD
jgi:predicted nucleic acid-binding protein